MVVVLIVMTYVMADMKAFYARYSIDKKSFHYFVTLLGHRIKFISQQRGTSIIFTRFLNLRLLTFEC
jgi:hypothetical protein